MNNIGYNAICAITGITIMMSLALYLGYDGVLLMSCVGIVAGIGGYPVAKEALGAFENIGAALTQVQKKTKRGPPR